MPTLHRTATAVLLFLLALALGAVPALATTDTQPVAAEDRTLTVRELGLTASAGFSSEVGTGGWIPVEIRLQPTRLFGGSLTLLTSTDVSQLAQSREIEVAAGTEKVFRFVVPPANAVQVRIAESGRDPLVSNVSLPPRRSSGFLVGYLGSAIPGTPPPIAAVASDLRGTYAAIDPAWLDVSTRALDGVSTLVVSSSQLAQLGEAATTVLRQAVALGMELVVVADTAGPIDLEAAGLPWVPATAATGGTVTVTGQNAGTDDADAAASGTSTQAVRALTPAPDVWTLTADDVDGYAGDAVLVAATAAGRGRVAVTGVGLGDAGLGGDARLWGHVLQPSARTLELVDTGSSLHRPVNLATEAVRTRGLSLPSLPWLTAFLIAFVLLVGPVNGFVLSRIGRRELAWMTIPAITLVFATGAYAGARGAQPPVGLGASATMWIDGQGQQLAISAVRSPREGGHVVTFPGDGWTVLPATRTQTPARVDRTSQGTTVSMDLGALQVGSVLGWRPSDQAAPLEVTATTPDGDSLEVTVRNTGPTTVNDLEVVAATHRVRLGDLAPGDTATERIAGLSTLDPREPWQEDFEGLRDLQGSPIAPRSLESVLRWQGVDGNPGVVWVLGTTAEHPDGSGRLPGSSRGATDDLGAFLAVGVTPRIADAGFGPVATQRALLPLTLNDFSRDAPTAIGTSGQAVLRYRLPNGTVPTQLVSTLHVGWNEHHFRGGGEVQAEECFEQEVFDRDGNVVGVEVVCQTIAQPEPVAPQPVPDCPPDAECSFDGELFEVCRPIEGELDEPGVGRECTVQVLAPGEPPPPGFEGNVQLEVYDHAAGRWQFLRDAARTESDGRITLEPARFLSPLGEVFVRASGELWPFDYSARGIGGIVGGAA